MKSVWFKKIVICFSFLMLLNLPNLAIADVEQDEDKFEGFNRAMFTFNSVLDHYIFRPIAVGYRAVTNQYVRDRISSVFSNLGEPVNAANNLLQGEFTASLKNIGRFGLNSTLGLFGTYDVAGPAWKLSPEKTSFDETLSSWCVGDGPFLVLPLLGNQTPRSVVGLTVDGFANPVVIAATNDRNYSAKIIYPTAALLAVSQREKAIELLDEVANNSLDPYVTLRSMYMQNRQKIKTCRFKKNESVESSYDFDFDEDDED